MDNAADEDARRARSARFATMPIVLAGTIAVTAGLTGPVAHAETHHDDDNANKRHVDQDRNVGDRPVFGTAVARPSQTTVTTVAATTKAPTTYTVRQGDTVSGIAARYGLSAQEVLVRNGLGWNTIIHPGQTLHLASTPAVTTASTTTTSSTGSYHVKQGDTVSGIASRVGVSTTALLSANKLSQRSVIYPGRRCACRRRGRRPLRRRRCRRRTCRRRPPAPAA
ncbi:LysM peptidoglycan-binding domain-containing protein [Curtobacterium flaccumfaciens]|nr:LysM peptidoglycan-binding domain-containing protein [Curtobacterium flaccumfaciens]